jgi:hypothetical protein
MLRKGFLFLTLIIVSLHVNGQKTIILKDSLKEFIFQYDYYSILEDKTGKLQISDIVTPENQAKFKVNTKAWANNDPRSSAFWIKFQIRKKARFDNNFLFESYSPHDDDLRLYLENGRGGWIEKRSGQSMYFYDREFVNKNLIFALPVDTAKIHTFYVRVYSKNYSSFDFRIKPFSYFTFYNTNEYFFLGIYYGILLIMAMYNLMLYFSIKEDVYIYYVLYVLAGMLTTLTDDCLGYQYVWFKFPQLNTPIGHHIAPSLLLITFVIYSRKFLDIKDSYPKYDKALFWSVIGYFAYYFLHLTILPEFLYFRSIYLIPFIVVYLSGVKSFREGYKPARFFVYGYTIIFFSIIIIQLRANGTIPGNLLTVYSLNYGLVLEIAVLSFAMADRIKYIKKEKEDALRDKNEAQQKIIDQLKINEELKDKVNRELEEKVAQRTKELNEKNKELEDTNSKLMDMTERANQMSLKLDLDNWNLQKNVKESIKARMSGKEVSYSEFNKIFPDEITCLRYLDELKWSESFKCRKCGNTKYINGVKVFSRKCTRCGYPESVTAYTLFHGLRFPINKAFYMTYLIHRKNKITLDELSVLIDLRRNTCWNFKKKILASIEAYQKTKKRPLETWEEIVLLNS